MRVRIKRTFTLESFSIFVIWVSTWKTW